MEAKKYRKIVTVSASVILIEGERDERMRCAVEIVEAPAVQKFIDDGFELIEIVTHTSSEKDATGIAYIMGLPANDKSPES